MFESKVQSLEKGRVAKYCISSDGTRLTYSHVLDLWLTSDVFRSFFSRLLADSEFTAYRWETPALSCNSLDRPFEFVLLDSPSFGRRETDSMTYEEYFTVDDTHHGVVTFANLRGDATLVVPSPRTDTDAYGHLASFVRLAPESQVSALWIVVADAVKKLVGENPLWLSTAGGGVAWLHVRLDTQPKYYGYSPYKQPT